MKKFYISPLVFEMETGVELGFCASPAGATLSISNNTFYDVQEED